jgi:4'-phosphopantetheinyl transferase EntD
VPEVVRRLFGSDVAVVTSDDLDPAMPAAWPRELEVLGSVAERRRREFVAGRRCARECIRSIGHDPAPVLIGARREPLWPPGLVGSITHTASFAAAAVAASPPLRGLGLDAEPDEALPAGVLERISRPEERVRLDALDPHVVRHPGRLLFSTKEAVYKVWYPMTGRWLDFDEVSVDVDPVGRRVEVEVLVDGPFSRLEGRYAISGGLILVAIELRER